MNRKQKIIVSVTGIFLVLLLLVGLTYGYFLTKITGNNNSKSISVSTANLQLVYGNDDGNVIGDGELIVPNTTFDAKTFTVTNEGNATTDYVVVIENATNNFKYNDFVYTLSCTSDGEPCTGVDTETTYPINGGVLVANTIEVGKTHTYSFTLKYVDTGSDQSDDMNKTLTGKINIADISTINPYSSDTNSLAYNIINNAIGLSVNQKSNGYAELLATPKTKVAQEISAEDESVLSIAQDDLGISYYFRGNIKNNYLTFNNMCWRIVRIEGDGAIKLLLEDKDAGCSSETLTKISSGIIGYTAYNSKKENDYENGEMNAAFNIFLNGGSFASYDYSISTSTTKTYTAWSEEAKSKLKSTKICLGDITTTYDETGNEFYNYNDNNCVFNGTCTYKKPLYYDSYVRLVGLGQTANATLKCDGEMTTEIQIYPLTADEVVFAGGKAMSSNKKYYMADTRDDYAWWWTISLAETYDYSHPFYARDGLYELSEIGDAHGLRPAVSLASNTTISSGDGTIDNPYIVE